MTIQFPVITLTYLALLGVLYAALSLAVVVLRGRLNIPYGTGDNELLLRAVRAHGNFAEWVPLITLLVAGLEMSGHPDFYIHLLMGILLAARVLHPLGLYSAVGTSMYFVGRISGALSTWLVLIATSGLLLVTVSTSAHADEKVDQQNKGIPMDQVTSSVANTYYDAFNGKQPLGDVPMHDDLKFVSPRFTLTNSVAFKGALSELFKRVKSLEISDQIHNDHTVLTFYDLDLGAPGGPIPMAERLRVEDGKLTHVDLIFDSARLPTPSDSTEAPGR